MSIMISRRDLRTFVNVTFDWSPRTYGSAEEHAIPRCHDQRIRRVGKLFSIGIIIYNVRFQTYYEILPGNKHLSSIIAKYEKDMETGRIVYPLTITG